ncbi:fumarylacetoacetate (FAA) hydrolase [Kibdelosporangium banguiense]|uniref:Fumarylacetoacetate (FAA) hydrolase n=1 Tax=Kibdelosporangium banguiense TaxID=1365924 RepID=A0ABS4TUB9_9PSEU|nr:fumarylacetoacetate hydrolase family protein [Kibdelosporangium banguiense]MBP2327564.1 fumarylacetoacetate (FAA) hydrolase [Kibdelosporangium banguiense]
MRLGSRRTGTRDGQLVLVTPDQRRALPVDHIAPTVQYALDHWTEVEGPLRAADDRLRSGRAAGVELADGDLLAPLPRAYAWIDCAAYPHPMELLAQLQGTEPSDPAQARRTPFYDGVGQFIASGQPLTTLSSDEMDIEAELAFVLADVERAASEKEACSAIIGITVVNDVTLRDLLRQDLAVGMGIYHAKPPSSMAPTIVTLDELDDCWDGQFVHAQMHSWVNGRLIGRPDTAVDMAATVPELIAQAARTRPLTAGTVLATGTVSNRDPQIGAACLGELRIRETLAHGAPTTSFLRPGDHIAIDLRAHDGSVAGTLHHTIAPDPTTGPVAET